MLKTVVSVALPVGEHLKIRKNVIQGNHTGKRLCVVTGTHGDELEGQFVCYELARRLNEGLEHLHGSVEIYPALNPLGIDSIERGFPGFDLDMNRIFPGVQNGHLAENTAYEIVQDLLNADMVLDIHSSNIFLKEVMQVRVSDITAETLVPYAKLLNTDFIWIHDAATVLESTLAHSLNINGTKTLVVEMGIGMRITREYGERLVQGIFNLMQSMEMWSGENDSNIANSEELNKTLSNKTRNSSEPTIANSILSTNGEVHFMNADASGIIIPSALHSSFVVEGERLCQIVDPFEGKVLQDILSPVDGFLFTLRTYPIVYEGSLIARIYEEKK
ncbi:hypothetical protein AGMMS49938_07970 [Fibrobacterales bacterium]|nr:hypothetical protein AGMMS49938_07970 [Fibrobacterales bacterium]